MKIAVYGLWHLGSVTAACLADKNYSVVGIDDDLQVVSNLQKGIPAISETGLPELITKNLNQNLSFTDKKESLRDADLAWVCFDTPVDDSDNADVAFVVEKIKSIFPFLKKGSTLLISSQLPVGTVDDLKKTFEKGHTDKKVYFAYSPENLRLGKAIEVFMKQERIILGCAEKEVYQSLLPLFKNYTDDVISMSVKSAEMVKHALNAFLATSVVFINEIATICESVGADAFEVEKGLKSEGRIGQKSYLSPGAAFAGGTLARDVKFLCQISENKNINLAMMQSLIGSNKNHQSWIKNKISKYCPDLSGKKVSIIGLSYKAGTSTLRRSQEVELCDWLNQNKAHIFALDPDVEEMPSDLKYINLVKTTDELLDDSEALIIAKKLSFMDENFLQLCAEKMKSSCVIDQKSLLRKTSDFSKINNYITIGFTHDAH